MARYSIIGGNPFRGYTGTGTFTSLKVAELCNTEEEVKAAVTKHYETCGGLLLVIDLQTGMPADNVPFGKE